MTTKLTRQEVTKLVQLMNAPQPADLVERITRITTESPSEKTAPQTEILDHTARWEDGRH